MKGDFVNARFARSAGYALIASLVALLALAGLTPAAAQTPASLGGAIVGSVRDAGSNPIAGVKLDLTGPKTATTTSGSDGSFMFSNLPAGTYSIALTKGAFKPQTVDGIVVADKPTAPLVIALSPASLSDLREIAHTSVNRKTSVNTSPAAISVLSNDDYLNQAQPQIKNLLDEIPGVELNQFSSGTPAAIATVSIRGAASYETENFVDGHPVADGYYGDFPVNFMSSLVYDGADVFKGAGFLGNSIGNAVGGSINFRTPAITLKPAAKVTVGYDTWAGSYYGVRFSDTIDKFGLLIDVARYGTPGYENNQSVPFVYYTTGSQNYTNVPGAVISDTLHLGQTYDNRAQVFKLAYNFSPTTTLTLGSNSSQTWADYTGTTSNFAPVVVIPCIDTFPPQNATNNTCTGNDNPPGSPAYNNPKYVNQIGKTVNGFYGFNGSFETDNQPIFTADLRTALGAGTFLVRSYAGSIYRTVNGFGESGQVVQCGDPACSPSNSNFFADGPYLQNENDRLHGVDAEFDYPVGNDILTAAFDRHSDVTDYCSGNPSFGPLFCPAAELFVQSRTYSLRGIFQATDRLKFELGNYFSNATYIGSRYDPRGGVTYRLNPNVALRASAGTAYVLPYAGIINPTSYISNMTLFAASALKPETSFSYNVGSDVVFGRYGKVSLDLYDTTIFNRFTTLSLPVIGNKQYNTIVQNFNISNSRDAGVELAINESPPVGFGFYGSMELARSYAYGIDTNTVGSAAGPYSYLDNGAQLPGHPFSKERLEASYTFPRGEQVRFGSWSWGSWNGFGEPGFTLFDGSLQLPLRTGLQFQLTAYNIFNHDDGRVYTEYQYGYNPIETGGGLFPVSLFFTRPRTFTVQLSKTVGP